ncbi:MAG: acyltransferase [Sporocytophaga sp.]|nr:acyltransferase [Sporocytophaga sp.]
MLKENREKQIIPNLNALRFISAFFVFLVHYFNYINPSQVYKSQITQCLYHYLISKGNLGVNFFFVLSGFLITHLLIAEKNLTGSISVKNFYLRRILRIWPIYYFIFFLGFFIYPLLTSKFSLPALSEHATWFAAFLGNIDRSYTDFTGIGCDLLGIMWTVSVEEQFYLFWPLLFFCFSSRKLMVLVFLLICFSLAFRIYNFTDYRFIYFHTFSVMSDLLVGCFAAFAINEYPTLKFKIENLSNNTIRFFYLSFFSFLLFQKELYMVIPLLDYFDRLIFSLFCISIILHQAYSKTGFKVGQIRYLENWGIISYGFYALHLLSIMFFQKLLLILKIEASDTSIYFLLGIVLTFSISIIISNLSYNYFESPFLKLKEGYVNKGDLNRLATPER